MKKRSKTIRALVRMMIALVALILVIIALLSINSYISSRHTPATSPVSTTSSQDSVDFSTRRDTPVVGAVRVNVTLKDFVVTSSMTTFHVGTPYYFVVTNRGPSVHEFTIVQAMPNGQPLADGGAEARQLFEIEQIGPGTTVAMNYTFTPENAGKYEIDCLMRGHYMAGMRLPIVIRGR